MNDTKISSKAKAQQRKILILPKAGFGFFYSVAPIFSPSSNASFMNGVAFTAPGS